MDDWQDHALSTRHMHNRNSRRGSGKGKKSSQFDVRKTFGEYEVKCASWERALGELNDEDDDDTRGDDAAFELLRLTDDGKGVLGELVLPGVMTAAVVLAATRRGLTLLTRSLAGEEEEDDDDDDDDNNNNDRHTSSPSPSTDENEEEDQDENARLSTFEKNSFRTPKFWLAWNGVLTIPRPASPPPPSPTHTRKTGSSFSFGVGSDSPPPSPTLHRTGSSFPPLSTHHQHQHHQQQQQQVAAEGTGYVVFTGAECRKFKGTLSCVELGWRDVSVSGFKRVSRSQSDRRLLWSGRDVETGWREGVDGGGQEDWGARLDARRRVVFD